MAYVPAANVAQAELRYTFQNEHVENVLYFEASASLTTALMTTLANDLLDWWNTNIKPLQVAAVSLREVFITDLTTSSSPTVSVSTGLPIAGTHGGDALPNNCSLCVSFRTAGRGRSARGRNYFLGLDEGSVTGSVVDGTYASNIVAAYDLLVGAGALTTGMEWVVVSRFTNGAPRTSALVQPITDALLVDTIVDSQRRRLPGRGR